MNSALRQTQIITYANGVQNKELALAKLLLEIDNMVLLLRVATDLKGPRRNKITSSGVIESLRNDLRAVKL